MKVYSRCPSHRNISTDTKNISCLLFDNKIRKHRQRNIVRDFQWHSQMGSFSLILTLYEFYTVIKRKTFSLLFSFLFPYIQLAQMM